MKIKKYLKNGVRSALVDLAYKYDPSSFGSVIKKNKDSSFLDYPPVYDYFNWPKKFNISQQNNNTHIWFVPDWSNVWGGGHLTLFRFANHFAKKGINSIIYIYNNSRFSDGSFLESDIRRAIPDSKLKVLVNPQDLPECDAVFATTWQSAYGVKAYGGSKHKFYFMQDYESLFYAHGTQSMQAMLTYSFGFSGICGGAYLKKMYQQHGGVADNYIFSTDRNIFFRDKEIVNDTIENLFFYGRPSTERRCFELGIESLKLISKKYPNIQINIAGLELNFTPPFKANMLGNLSLEQTGDLYRKCDVGIAFSGTNLSYLPVELMASGCPVITNRGDHVEWYCNNQNSILVDPVPSAVLNAFDHLYNSAETRQRISNKGIDTSLRRTWDSEMDYIYDYVIAKVNGKKWIPRQ